MKFLILQEVDSTNSYVALHDCDLDDMTMVIADAQTAGRGQRGNSWESEPGKNLTFTLLYRNAPVSPALQFAISEATALAIADFLMESGIEATVKWPNDIYTGDSKIAGILIEHSIMGSKISSSRIGVGLNVNQTEFQSDAPNPVSMSQITGQHYDISRVAAFVGLHLESRLAQLADENAGKAMHTEFCARLWRRQGVYPFLHKAENRRFAGSISGVSPLGPISILDNGSGETVSFAFKEVEFLL